MIWAGGDRKNKWYLFDDEVVSEVEDLNAPDRYDDEEKKEKEKDNKTTASSAKTKNGFTRDENGDMLVWFSLSLFSLLYTNFELWEKQFTKIKRCLLVAVLIKTAAWLLTNSFSKDMLVYIRRSSQPSPAKEPVPPPLALSHVEALDQKHGGAVEEYMTKFRFLPFLCFLACFVLLMRTMD